jgi:FkbM family methyltransferase
MSLIHRLAHLFYPRGSVRRVIRGPVRGLKFEVVSGMGATYALGMDVMNLGFLTTKLRPGMVVYDVGGNCGQMALYFSAQVGGSGRVFSFEPVPENFARLLGNIRMNDLANVEAFETAVGSDLEPKSFCFDSAHHTMGTFTSTMVKLAAWEQTITVACTTLDAWAADGRPGPAVIKIDVEGAGLEVVKGAAGLIEKHRPGIYFEIHAADAAAPELQALAMLKDKWGYRITDLNGTLQGELGPMWGAAVWCEPPQS